MMMDGEDGTYDSVRRHLGKDKVEPCMKKKGSRFERNVGGLYTLDARPVSRATNSRVFLRTRFALLNVTWTFASPDQWLRVMWEALLAPYRAGIAQSCHPSAKYRSRVDVRPYMLLTCEAACHYLSLLFVFVAIPLKNLLAEESSPALSRSSALSPHGSLVPFLERAIRNGEGKPMLDSMTKASARCTAPT